MKEPMDPEDQKILLPMLRAFLGWEQKDLAHHARVSLSTVWRWEHGFPMRRRNYERIVEITGLPLALVESQLLPVIRAGRAALAGGGALGVGSSSLNLEALTEARRAAFSALIEELGGRSAVMPADSSWEAKTWRFVEGLCHESAEAASSDAARAVSLAELALRFAQRAPGEGQQRLKLEGYVWAFLGNAQRVAGSLPSSEASFACAEKTWASWKGDTPIPLGAWRLPDMKASLRRHQGRFAEALALHEEALGLAPPEVVGRILLKKAFTLEQQGETYKALAELQAAEAHLETAHEPRLRRVLEFNRIVLLCHLERFPEAAKRLAAIKSMVEAAGQSLDQIRVLWLESKVFAGCGRRSEAADLLDRVRREFLSREIAFDAALATLELAVLYLEEGRTTEVRRIASELAPIFAAQRVARETFACVELFIKAVQHDTLTTELARGWLNELKLYRRRS